MHVNGTTADEVPIGIMKRAVVTAFFNERVLSPKRTSEIVRDIEIQRLRRYGVEAKRRGAIPLRRSKDGGSLDRRGGGGQKKAYACTPLDWFLADY
jgi:hypothetical protein